MLFDVGGLLQYVVVVRCVLIAVCCYLFVGVVCCPLCIVGCSVLCVVCFVCCRLLSRVACWLLVIGRC